MRSVSSSERSNMVNVSATGSPPASAVPRSFIRTRLEEPSNIMWLKSSSRVSASPVSKTTILYSSFDMSNGFTKDSRYASRSASEPSMRSILTSASGCGTMHISPLVSGSMVHFSPGWASITFLTIVSKFFPASRSFSNLACIGRLYITVSGSL